jgi:butyryl-CoA dehydrogenase
MGTTLEESDTQAMLRDSLSRYLDEQYGFETRRRALAAAIRCPPPLWKGLASDLGILGASFSEVSGSLGGADAANHLIMEVLGTALASEPYLSTVVIGGGLLRRGGGRIAEHLIPLIIEGEAVFAFAHSEPHGRPNLSGLQTTLSSDGTGFRLDGCKAVVQNAPWATHLIVTARSNPDAAGTAGVSVLVVDPQAPGIVIREYPTRDGGRAADIDFESVHVGRDALIGEAGEAFALLDQVMDEATLAICAEAIGVLRRMMTDTLAYARERRQFGVPLASFQALQHRMADMFMALEMATTLVQAVAPQLDSTSASRRRAVSSAKVAVCKACRTVAQGAIQIHGAMGVTEELPIGHYFRRATLLEGLFGSLDFHLRRYEQSASAAA